MTQDQQTSLNTPASQTSLYSNPQVIAFLKIFSATAGYILAIFSLLALIGWGGGMPAMKASTDPLLAVPFIFLGLALIFLSFNFLSSSGWLLPCVKAFVIVTIFLALLRLFGVVFNSIPGLNQILFGEKFQGDYLGVIHTTANFIAISLAIYFIDFEYPNKIRPSQLLAFFVIFSSLFVVLSYAYDVQFNDEAKLTFKALITMLFFILVSLGILCLRPDLGFITLISSNSLGGTLARRLLPACFFVPTLLGMLGILGERCGFYNREFLLVIVVILNVVVFSGLIWWLAHLFYGIDTGRKQMEEARHQTSLTDDLTGLYNRRGFRLLAEQQIKIAKRDDQACVMFFADMDGLKRINDSFGHKEGDQALVRMSQILKSSFRDTDIIARFAGDEFAVLCVSADPDRMNILTERLENEIQLHRNKTPWLPYQLSFSFGVGFLEGKDATIEKLMLEADKKLYEIKRRKKKSTSVPLIETSVSKPVPQPPENPQA